MAFSQFVYVKSDEKKKNFVKFEYFKIYGFNEIVGELLISILCYETHVFK